MAWIRSPFADEITVLRERNYQLLLLSALFPFLGTSLVSPVLDSLVGPFGATPTEIGLVVSFFTFPPILTIPLAGLVADRVGRKPVLVWSLVGFGGAGAAIALTTDFRVVLALRFVQGVAFGGLVPVITTSIGDAFTGSEEETAQGLRMTVNGISGAVLPSLAGALVVVAWQYPFLLYATALPVAAAVFMWFDEPPAIDASDGPDADSNYLRSLFELVARRPVSVLLVARALPVVVWISFLTYNSFVVVRIFDGTPFQAGMLVALGNVSFALSASQTGRLGSATGGRLLPLVAGNFFLGGGFGGMVLAPTLWAAAVGISIAGIGLGITIPLYRSILTELAPDHLRGGLVSLSATGPRVLATATPIALGYVIAIATPVVGFASAVQIATLGAAAVGGGGGVVALAVAYVR